MRNFENYCKLQFLDSQEMDNDQIFIFDTHHSHHYDHSIEDYELPRCDPYLEKGDSIRYVAQFLTEFPTKGSERTQQKLPDNENKGLSLDVIQSEGNISPVEQNENVSELTSSQNPVHSVFHNFQKHLTIFLRSILKPDQIKGINEESLVAKDLWKVFYKSSVNAKRIIHVVLGELDPKGKEKELKQLGVKELYAKNSTEKVNKAKQILRQYVKMAIQKTNLEEYLNRTRIKNKEYFELYLKEFIEELQEGVFKRRIRRDRVLKNIN